LSVDPDTVTAITMPQVNVNDEEVTLIGWHVENGECAVAGEPLCEVETSKAVGDVPAPASGVFRPAVQVGDVVAIGQVIGYSGPSVEAIERYLAEQARRTAAAPAASTAKDTGVEATAGAIELARRWGIDIDAVRAEGKVRRADVERYLSEHPEITRVAAHAYSPADGGELPSGLADAVIDEGELSEHQWSIARHLAATQARLVTAHVVMDVSMAGVAGWMASQRQAGRVVGPLPILLHAAAAAVGVCPKLAAFRLGRRIYRYRSVDIAYTTRSADGRLFTPVVRGVDARSLEELADECTRLNMEIFRGRLDPGEMIGGCLTVSALIDQPVRFHIGLQNTHQSALLTSGAIRDEVALLDGEVTTRPVVTLTLSYDHGLLDGWEAAAALEAAKTAIEAINV